CGVAHDVVAARVDAQRGDAQAEEPLRDGLQQRRAVEAAAGAVGQTHGVERGRGGRRRRLEGPVEPDAVAGRRLHQVYEHGGLPQWFYVRDGRASPRGRTWALASAASRPYAWPSSPPTRGAA